MASKDRSLVCNSATPIIRKGSFTFCATNNSSTAWAVIHCALPQGWVVECPPQSLEACNSWLAANWSTLTLPTMQPQGAGHEHSFTAGRGAAWDLDMERLYAARRMECRPLCRAARQLDLALLGRAIVTGLTQADTSALRR